MADRKESQNVVQEIRLPLKHFMMSFGSLTLGIGGIFVTDLTAEAGVAASAMETSDVMVGKETTDVVAVGVVITDHVLTAGMVKDMIKGQEGAVRWFHSLT